MCFDRRTCHHRRAAIIAAAEMTVRVQGRMSGRAGKGKAGREGAWQTRNLATGCRQRADRARVHRHVSGYRGSCHRRKGIGRAGASGAGPQALCTVRRAHAGEHDGARPVANMPFCPKQILMNINRHDIARISRGAGCRCMGFGDPTRGVAGSMSTTHQGGVCRIQGISMSSSASVSCGWASIDKGPQLR